MTEFESADRYFQPDDPAVWNPERFTPQHRLRNFLPRWRTKNGTTQQPSSAVKYNDNAINGPTATQFLIPAMGGHIATSPFLSENKLPTTTAALSPECITMLSESLDSLTRTSYSSEGQQEVKDGEDQHDDDHDHDHDAESCCGSLTYSVESEWLIHHQKHEHHNYLYPHTVSTLPRPDMDIYEDALERLDHQDTTTKVLSSKKNDARNNCFQPASGDCFHPLAWVGDLFRSSSSPSGRRIILLSHEDDDAIQERIDDF
jgi:hypothetical protein